MSDLSGRLSGSQAISGSLSGGSVLRGGLSMGGGVSPELLLDKADVITDTASGSIVSISDGMASPVLGLDVEIEPIQDLHGYDKPWPAGGGKNKADYPYMIQNGCVEQTDGSLYLQRASALANKTVYTHDGAGQIAVTFIVKNNTGASSRGACPQIKYTDGTSDDVQTIPSLGSFTTYTKVSKAEKTVASVTFTYGSRSVETWFYIQVESGSTATAWTPYSNICPINGRSEVNVYLEESYDPQATPKATIQLGQTVYGGTLDVTSGKLVIDRAYRSVTDMPRNWNKLSSGTGAFYIARAYAFPNMKYPYEVGNPSYPISDTYLYSAGGTMHNGMFRVSDALYIVDDRYSTVSEFLEAFAQNPFSFVYELSTPVEVTLTPQEIAILQGTNNIWADSGNVSVNYRCDTKKYILKKIAEALNA